MIPCYKKVWKDESCRVDIEISISPGFSEDTRKIELTEGHFLAPAELEQVARSAFEAGRAVYSSTDNVHVWNDFNHWQTQNKNLTIKTIKEK
jgi:hypothetical protein